MKSIVAAVMIAVCLPLSALAALNSNDSNYLQTEMQSQLGRYAIASLAQKNAASSSVKNLAKTIALQSAAATRDLDAIAKRNGIPPATHPSVRDSFHYSELSAMHGKAFDQSFLMDVKIDDEMMQSRDQTAAKQAQDPALRAFAQRHGATLAKELKQWGSVHP
jgi:putative membrane protein